MKSLFSYYKDSFLLAFIGIAVAWLFAGPQGALLAGILAILETSLSLDNAVVNAKVLERMDDKWRGRFLTWGMLFSVFFVRFLFPILIVYATSRLSLWGSFVLPFTDAKAYETIVSAADVKIAGFGGAFLMLVFLSFFVDVEKEEHWLPGIEKLLTKFGTNERPTIPLVGIAVAILFAVAFALPSGVFYEFLVSGGVGIATWIIVQVLGDLLDADNAGAAVAKAGLGTFIYLNILDASFSFDGVIGAFAVSNDIVIITCGLAIGAMFVRCMTLHVVDKGTLGTLRYIEHGAFWSIGTLAAMMFIGIVHHIPEVVTGLSAAAILGIATIHSLIANKQEADLAHGAA